MSNPIGGAMLNQILHGLVELGLLQEITALQKSSLCQLLSRMASGYDCTWSEIIDVDLAVLLSTCIYCRRHSVEICPANGFCLECSEHARQNMIRWGEICSLRRLLEYRFGTTLPYWVHETMRTASEETLLRWSERLLENASSLEAIFGSSGEALRALH